MEEIIFFLMVFSIPLTVILTRFYLRLQELKLKHGGTDSNEMKKELGNLMSENEDLKERVKNLEYLMNDETRRIQLDYEKEQILIDKQNKTF